MSFADDYRSEVRSSIVDNLSTMAEDEGVTPTEQWCDNRRDDILPVVTGDDNGSWTCNTATSTENINGVMFSADWDEFIHSDYAYDAPLDDAENLEICYREYLFDEEFPAAVAEFLR